MDKSLTRGRPFDPEKQQLQKDKLLNAAQSLLVESSYRDITIRELADLSGVNSAMVSYYFTNKEGLFMALLDKMSEEHFGNMKQIAHAPEPIKKFIFFILEMLSKNSGFARFVYDEINGKNSQLGDAFMQRFPKRMATILPKLVKAHTGIDDDVKAKYAAFNLMSMIIMPFVGKSVREQAWNIKDEEIRTSEWAEHIYSMFIAGCGEKSLKS